MLVILGVLFLIVPLYHHILWLFVWNKHTSLGHLQKKEHFFDFALLPEAIHQYVAFFLPIIAFIFLGKSMNDLKTTTQRTFNGFLMILAVLCWGLTSWSLL
jgi:hypothetical protein